MKAEPKAAVDGTVLPFRSRKTGSARFEAFCSGLVTVPKGMGARRMLRLRPWQLDLVGSVWDANPRPRLAGWMLPRGQGKTSGLTNPALGDFLYDDPLAALLPPKTREATFRRARLCQFAHEVDDPWLPPRAWEGRQHARPIEDGAPVVLALDGSFSQDCSACCRDRRVDRPRPRVRDRGRGSA